MEALAELTIGRGHFDQAARLLAACEAIRAASRLVRQPRYQPAFDRCLAAARDRLGDEAFALAWAEGAAMSLSEATAYAQECMISMTTMRRTV